MRARAWWSARARAPAPSTVWGGELLGKRAQTEPFAGLGGWALALPLCEVWAFLVPSGNCYWWGRRQLVGKRGGSSIADKALVGSASRGDVTLEVLLLSRAPTSGPVLL